MKKILLLSLFAVLCVINAHAKTDYKKHDDILLTRSYKGRFNPERRGYMGIVTFQFGVGDNMGMHIGRGDGSSSFDFGGFTGGVDIVNGYRFGHHFAMGIGVGFRAYTFSASYGDLGYPAAEYCIPVYLHLRSNFLKRDISPFFSLNLGYNPAVNGPQYYHTSVFAEPSVGVDIRINDKQSFILSLGSSLLFPYAYKNPYTGTLGTFVYRANFNVGFMF